MIVCLFKIKNEKSTFEMIVMEWNGMEWKKKSS